MSMCIVLGSYACDGVFSISVNFQLFNLYSIKEVSCLLWKVIVCQSPAPQSPLCF